jgi:hypothetical protein
MGSGCLAETRPRTSRAAGGLGEARPGREPRPTPRRPTAAGQDPRLRGPGAAEGNVDRCGRPDGRGRAGEPERRAGARPQGPAGPGPDVGRPPLPPRCRNAIGRRDPARAAGEQPGITGSHGCRPPAPGTADPVGRHGLTAGRGPVPTYQPGTGSRSSGLSAVDAGGCPAPRSVLTSTWCRARHRGAGRSRRLLSIPSRREDRWDPGSGPRRSEALRSNPGWRSGSCGSGGSRRSRGRRRRWPDRDGCIGTEVCCPGETTGAALWRIAGGDHSGRGRSIARPPRG